MIAYIVRRLGFAALSIWVISVVAFLWFAVWLSEFAKLNWY